MPPEEGSAEERAHLIDIVRRRAAAQPSGNAPVRAGAKGGTRDGRGNRTASICRPATSEAFNRAVGAVNAGRGEEAWKLLAPIIDHAKAKKVGRRHLAAHRRAGRRLTGALTRADEAAGARRQGARSAEDRRRHRVDPAPDRAAAGRGEVRCPAREGAGLRRGLLRRGPADRGRRRAAARARLAELTAAFPDAPGVDVLVCDTELRAKHLPAATKRCEAALAKFKGATRAHYFLALIAIRARREPVAEQHLRQAILLDPAGSDLLADAGPVLSQHRREPPARGARERAPAVAVVAAARVTP